MGASPLRFEEASLSRKPSYVSLFSGAGGLDIGLERAGFKTHSLCEIEEVFCKTLRSNQGYTHSDGVSYFEVSKILNADIRDLTRADFTFDAELDLLVGGPPCQAFSSSGKQLSVLDPRGTLVHEFIRMVHELRPRMFLFENVRGLVTARDAHGEPGGLIRALFDRFQELGYSCRATLLNSADFGSYQRRVRCFIVGSMRGVAPFYPDPIYRKKADLFYPSWRSLGAFLGEHADPEKENYTFPSEKLGQQLKDLPDGAGCKSAGRVEKTRPGGHWGYRQGTFIADLSLPARTVTGSASQDWVRWNGCLRRLTLNEVKLLQGFPLGWEFYGTKAERFRQVGNAVPTVFGELLGAMMLSFLKHFPNSKPVRLDMPTTFNGYIAYTKKDHERNALSRVVHRKFGPVRKSADTQS